MKKFILPLLLIILTISPTTVLANDINNSNIASYNPKILVIRIDPTLYSQGNILASEFIHYNNASAVTSKLIDSFVVGSNNLVHPVIIKTEILNEFPSFKTKVKLMDGTFAYRLDEKTWIEMMKNGWNGYWNNEYGAAINSNAFSFDYDYLIAKFDLIARKNRGEFDQVWLVDLNDSMVYESIMVGRNSYWINGQNIVASCGNFEILTVTIPRNETNMECFGHSSEAILTKAFGYGSSMWKKFTQTDATSKGNAVAGNVHFAPNSTADYDWDNATLVYSAWKDWKDNYPALTGSKILTNNSSWKTAGLDINTAHKRWWFSVMPHVSGRDYQGFSNNWWDYLMTLSYATAFQANNGGLRTVNVGDEINNLTFTATLSSGVKNTYTVDVVSANISLENNNIIIKNGRLVAQSAGDTKIIVYFDGLAAAYNVTIVAKTIQETTTNPPSIKNTQTTDEEKEKEETVVLTPKTAVIKDKLEATWKKLTKGVELTNPSKIGVVIVLIASGCVVCLFPKRKK